MLDYAVKLTDEPERMAGSDVQALRDAGFGDQAVLDICQVVSYYAYANRLADGLGIELEDGWTDDELTVTREELHTLGGPGTSGDR